MVYERRICTFALSTQQKNYRGVKNLGKVKFETTNFRIALCGQDLFVQEILKSDLLQKSWNLRPSQFSIWPPSAILNIEKHTTVIGRHHPVLKTKGSKEPKSTIISKTDLYYILYWL